MDLIDKIINKLISWGDEVVSQFKGYSASYSKYLVYGLLLFILAKMLKVKVDLNVGKSGSK